MTQAADPQTLEQVLRQSGVQQGAARASWAEYAEVLVEAFFRWTASWVAPLVDLLPPGVAVFVAWGLVALLTVVLLALLMRLVLRRARSGPAVVRDVRVAAQPAPPRTPAAWRAEAERCLAAGDARTALLAVWWWFATSATAEPVDPAWTSREVVVRARRPELLPLTSALDRMAYGANAPDAEDVRGLMQRLASVLA